MYRTHADIGLSKRSKNNPTEKERFNITKTGGPRMTGKEIKRPGTTETEGIHQNFV